MLYFSPEFKTFRSIWSSVSTLLQWHALRTHALAQLGWTESRLQRRSIDEGRPIPWIPYSCGHFLDQVVPTDAHILEIGGGSSTFWWLSRGNTVTTIETDPVWAAKIAEECQSFSSRLTINIIEPSAVLNAIQLMATRFDVVVNDGHGDRLVLAQALKTLLKPVGILVWDNSDRFGVPEILKELHEPHESRLDFFGLGPINAYCSQTTLISLGPIKSQGRESTFKNIVY
jgi:hypothetical protein